MGRWPGDVSADTDPVRIGRILRYAGLRDQLHPRDAVACTYPDRAYFEESARRDREIWGNRIHGPWETEAGLIAIVDITPQLREGKMEITDPALPDTWKPGEPQRVTISDQ